MLKELNTITIIWTQIQSHINNLSIIQGQFLRGYSILFDCCVIVLVVVENWAGIKG